MAEVEEKIVKRSDKIAFLNTGTAEEPKYERMRKFTELSNSRNPQEYSRQYVDRDGEDTDVTGFSPEKGFAFDEYANNPVHKKLVDIIEDEKKGNDAIVDILVVDKSRTVEAGGYEARRRNYTVVADSDGDETNAYTYSGSFKSNGEFEKVTATLDEKELIATIKKN